MKADDITSLKVGDNVQLNHLLNLIIKEGFKQTDLRQIGKQPRFFDIKNAQEVANAGLIMWPGFKASAYNYEVGLTLVIDNISKFMSTKSCLETIQEIKSCGLSEYEELVVEEFKHKSVIANWGNKKAHIVHDVNFKLNPKNCTFKMDDEEISVAEYFKLFYNKEIKYLNQPLFEVK